MVIFQSMFYNCCALQFSSSVLALKLHKILVCEYISIYIYQMNLLVKILGAWLSVASVTMTAVPLDVWQHPRLRYLCNQAQEDWALLSVAAPR